MKLLTFNSVYCPVGWGCRIHRLLLCRGIRPLPTSVHDMTQNNLMVRFQQCWSFGEYGVPHLLASLPDPLWPGMVAPDKGPIYGLNRAIYRASFTFMIFAFKLRIYAKLNCLK